MTAKSTSYRGRHAGKSGVVANAFTRDDGSFGSIAVMLDKERNKKLQFGLFYFKAEELQVALQEASVLFHTTASQITTKMNVNGENENMKSEKILSLWKKAGMESIENAMKSEEGALIAVDTVYTQLREHVLEIDRITSDGRNRENYFSSIFDCERFASDATKQKIAEVRINMKTMQMKLNDLTEEIAAMLSACDTYEQEMNVLQTYGVIDEDWRLNKVFIL